MTLRREKYTNEQNYERVLSNFGVLTFPTKYDTFDAYQRLRQLPFFHEELLLGVTQLT